MNPQYTLHELLHSVATHLVPFFGSEGTNHFFIVKHSPKSFLFLLFNTDGDELERTAHESLAQALASMSCRIILDTCEEGEDDWNHEKLEWISGRS